VLYYETRVRVLSSCKHREKCCKGLIATCFCGLEPTQSGTAVVYTGKPHLTGEVHQAIDAYFE
jgi:hypothetical protein